MNSMKLVKPRYEPAEIERSGFEKLKPREKLVNSSPGALNDEELLAILFGSGTKDCDVFKLAKLALKLIDEKNGSLNIKDLLSIKGLGLGKASKILACLEFSRRRIKPNGLKIKSPSDAVPLLHHLISRKQECFVAISLNGANEVIETRIITIGLINFCQVHPREVLADIITDRACSFIVAHNHPSGNLEPSDSDKTLTKRLAAASQILGIELLDHIIISSKGHYSFREHLLL